MKELKPILVGLSLIILLAFPELAFSYVPERGNVTATLGPYIFRTNYEGASEENLNSPRMGGVSLTALGDVSDHGSLEVLMLYMNKIYFRTENAKSIAEKIQLMHITMGYRYWISNYLSASFGLYTSYPMGDSQVIRTDFTQSEDFSTTAGEKSESGLDIAVQVELWSKERFAIVMEGRYSYSLTKKANEFADHYGGSIGLRYFIQSSEQTADKAVADPLPVRFPSPGPQTQDDLKPENN